MQPSPARLLSAARDRTWASLTSRQLVLPAAVAAVATLVSLILRVRSPLWIRADFLLDDGLFADLGGALAHHEWLGDFTSRTLAKGPAYPMFIAASYLTHTPLALAEQLLYLVASGVTCIALARIAHSRWLGVSAYVALALNPVHLGATGSLVIREVVYTSLALLTLGATLLMIDAVPGLVRARYGVGFGGLAIGGTVIGVSAAGYYLCREERAWLAPALLIGVAAAVWNWRGRLAPVGVRLGIGVVVLGLASSAAFLGGIHLVTQRNKDAYGVAIVSDLADGQFARAYSLWQSVESGRPQVHIPVSEAARRAVFAVSPAAAELRVPLDTPKGAARHWVTLSGRGDYIGAFFVWALREAAAAAGHFHNEADFQSYFKQVADQIQSACDDHRLSCGRLGLPVLPAITSSDVPTIATSYREAVAFLLSFDSGDPHRTYPSSGLSPQWGDATRAIPQARDQQAYRRAERDASRRQWPVSVLQFGYRWLAYPAAVFGLIALLWEFIWPRRHGRAFAFALLAVLVAALSRVAVVALVDALSYTAVHNQGYAIPGSDLLVLFGAAGSYLFIAKTVDQVRERRPVLHEEPEAVLV